MENLSISDALALTKSNESGFSFGGVGGLILILLFFFIFGGGFWGNRNGCENGGISDLERDVLRGDSTTQNAVFTSSCETQKGVMQANYDTLLGFKDQQMQIANCCCENRLAISEQTNALTNAIHSDGEATRALITQNRIADLEYQLNQANNAVANAVQTQNILSNLGRYVTNPSTPVSYGYGYGYNGYFNGGTTII